MMPNDDSPQSGASPKNVFSAVVAFFGEILKDVASSLMVIALTFAFATTISAVVLWYYGWPLFLSPVGGFIVLGVMLLFWYDH